jgi:hypothetical protein
VFLFSERCCSFPSYFSFIVVVVTTTTTTTSTGGF